MKLREKNIMKQKHGWIYREPAVGVTPARMKVSLNLIAEPGKEARKEEKVFDDNNAGAQEAANYISSVVGDSWKIEDCAFLGYRIFTEF